MSRVTLEWALLDTNERIQAICRDGVPILIANDWLLKKFRDSLSPKTEFAYAQRLVVFFKWLDTRDLSIETITQRNLYEFRDALDLEHGEEGYLFQKGEISENTKAQTLGCALRFLNWVLVSMDEQPILTSNRHRAKHSFLRGITTPQLTNTMKSLVKKRKKQLPKYLTKQEFDIVRDWIDRTWEQDPDLRVRNRAMFELLFDTGVRIGELCSLKIVDMDDDARTIRVSFDDEMYALIRKTGNKRIPLQKTGERVVVISDRTIQLLSEYVTLNRPRESVKFGHGFLFCSHRPPMRGKPMTANAVEHIFQRMNAPVSEGGCAISKHLHAHLLRHTSATFFTKKGVNFRAVQQNLGHQNPESTQICQPLSVAMEQRLLSAGIPIEYMDDLNERIRREISFTLDDMCLLR